MRGLTGTELQLVSGGSHLTGPEDHSYEQVEFVQEDGTTRTGTRVTYGGGGGGGRHGSSWSTWSGWGNPWAGAVPSDGGFGGANAFNVGIPIEGVIPESYDPPAEDPDPVEDFRDQMCEFEVTPQPVGVQITDDQMQALYNAAGAIVGGYIGGPAGAGAGAAVGQYADDIIEQYLSHAYAGGQNEVAEAICNGTEHHLIE